MPKSTPHGPDSVKQQLTPEPDDGQYCILHNAVVDPPVDVPVVPDEPPEEFTVDPPAEYPVEPPDTGVPDDPPTDTDASIP